MKRKWNNHREATHFFNQLSWSYLLYRVPCGKGSSLNIEAVGMDNRLSKIRFTIRKIQKGYRRSNMESKYRKMLMHNSGICWICGEIHPRVLEGHHLYESRSENKHGNTLKDDFICGICANCHRKRKVTGGETERHQIAILKAIEKEWFGLGGDIEDETK